MKFLGEKKTKEKENPAAKAIRKKKQARKINVNTIGLNKEDLSCSIFLSHFQMAQVQNKNFHMNFRSG